MKTTTLSLVIASASVTALFTSCQQGTVGTMQPRVNVEASEANSPNVPPNNNHGQHAAGANAVDYSNPGHRGGWYGAGRSIPGL